MQHHVNRLYAETINQWPNEMIAWRSLPGSEVETAGSIHFTPQTEQSTAVRVSMKYNPPAGKLGIAIAKLLGDDLEEKLQADLEQFKARMEQGVLSAAAK